jgi:uncharacterized membrane protein
VAHLANYVVAAFFGVIACGALVAALQALKTRDLKFAAGALLLSAVFWFGAFAKYNGYEIGADENLPHTVQLR